MSTSLDEQASRTVRRILYDSWDETNTASYDPTLDPDNSSDALPIHYGNYDSSLPDPQISLTQPQGEVTRGGRWSGMDGSDGTMNQFRLGQIICICWADAGNRDYNGENAEGIVSLLRHEVERIVGNHTLGPDSGNNSGKIWSFSAEWNGRFISPDNDDPTAAWQSQLTIRYDWERNTGE